MSISNIGYMQEEFAGLPAEKFSTYSEITRIAYLVLKSPLMWTCASIVYVGCSYSPFIALGYVTCLVGVCFFYPEKIPDHLLYELALIDSLVREWLTQYKIIQFPYYNEIFPGVYLGALPLKSHNHHFILPKDLHVKAVLSLVESFELQTNVFFASPVHHKAWKTAHIEVCHISIRDMTMLSLEMLHEAADFIKKHEQSIYIHCKAGRGRSVAAFMAYLIKYKDMSYEEAYAFMKDKRPIITLNKSQQEGLKAFGEAIQKRRLHSPY